MTVLPPPDSVVAFMEAQNPGGYWRLIRPVLDSNAGVRVRATSWFRDPRTNREVGGSDSSQHLVGYAVDLVYADPRAMAIAAMNMRRAGLGVIDEGDHLHVQLLPAGALAASGVLTWLFG